MKIADCKVGDKVKVPITKDGLFIFDFDGKLRAEKSTLTITIIAKSTRQYSNATKVAWKDHSMEGVYSRKYLTDYPELHAKYPNLEYCVDLNADVPCELVKKASDGSSSLGMLLGMMGVGALASYFAASCASKQVKEMDSDTTRL